MFMNVALCAVSEGSQEKYGEGDSKENLCPVPSFGKEEGREEEVENGSSFPFLIFLKRTGLRLPQL